MCLCVERDIFSFHSSVYLCVCALENMCAFMILLKGTMQVNCDKDIQKEQNNCCYIKSTWERNTVGELLYTVCLPPTV